MTTNWLGALLYNKTLTDEEYEDIPYPRLELHTHVFWKHVQVRWGEADKMTRYRNI